MADLNAGIDLLETKNVWDDNNEPAESKAVKQAPQDLLLVIFIHG